MSLIWWLFPLLCAVLGIVFLFTGIARLLRVRLVSGLIRVLMSSVFIGLSATSALIGLTLVTYNALTYERAVMLIQFEATSERDFYTVMLTYPDGVNRMVSLSGDEWELNARILKLQALSNIFGFDSAYRLDRLYGRYEDVARAGDTNGLSLSPEYGIDLTDVSVLTNNWFSIEDTRYGSATYNPMRAGLAYKICMTQSGLIARPHNQRTADFIGTPYRPDEGCRI